MIASNNIASRAHEIRILIASDDMQNAIKKLLDYIQDFSGISESRNEAIVISSNLNNLKRESRRKTINSEQYAERRNKLLYQMLELVDEVQDDFFQKKPLVA